jgi:uncharacterized protein (DUF849 family)
MLLQACLNGNRTKGFNAGVPISAKDLARDARAVIEAGADELHLHPRDADGVETLEAETVSSTIRAVRSAVPGVPLGLSTHWAIPPGGLARQRKIWAWAALPDYVSVNLADEDAPQVISLALQKGISVEAGLWSVEDARRFVTLEDARRCLRVLIEIFEQDERGGCSIARAIVEVLDANGMMLPRLLHGYEKSKWPLFRYALALGLDSRIGFEDGGLLPTGETAPDNASLIRAARRLIQSNKELLPNG